MSRTANCYDHAAMESFFDTLPSVCVNRTQFYTHAQARSAIFAYLECRYNRSAPACLNAINLKLVEGGTAPRGDRSKRVEVISGLPW